MRNVFILGLRFELRIKILLLRGWQGDDRWWFRFCGHIFTKANVNPIPKTEPKNWPLGCFTEQFKKKSSKHRSSWVSLGEGQPYLTIPHTNPGFQNNYVGLDAMNNLRKSISGDTEKPKNYQCMALFVCQLMEAAKGGGFWDWSVWQCNYVRMRLVLVSLYIVEYSSNGRGQSFICSRLLKAPHPLTTAARPPSPSLTLTYLCRESTRISTVVVFLNVL